VEVVVAVARIDEFVVDRLTELEEALEGVLEVGVPGEVARVARLRNRMDCVWTCAVRGL
jgi:hypothetical protein